MRSWFRAAIVGPAAVALLLVPATTGWARTPQPVTARATRVPASAVPGLRAALRAGTLSRTTGVDKLCADEHLACQVEALTVSKKSKQLLVTGTPVGLGAQDLEDAYGLAGARAGSGTIAIIDAGAYPTLESDLAIYRATYGLPRCTAASRCFRQVKYTGGVPYAPSTDPWTSYVEELVGEETALDVEMASAACPHCTILEVQIPALDAVPEDQASLDVAAEHFAIASATAVRLGAKAVSMSYAYPTDSYTDHGAPAKGLAHRGVAVIAASGDSGANFDGNGWPSNLTTVIAAGGTSLYPNPATRRGFTETAWNGAGSGCSADLGPANHQPDAVTEACYGSRADTDVSAVADPYTGVAVYDSFAPATGEPVGFTTVGGTSVATPFIAGMYVRAGVRSGVLGPNELYEAPGGVFNDIVVGTNAGPGQCAAAGFDDDRLCTAGPGWDGPTGLGTPNGLATFG